MKNDSLEIHNLSPLFEDVQRSNLFEDSKTFPDCEPKKDLQHILDNYLSIKGNVDFNLKEFINQYFILPKAYASGFSSNLNNSTKDHVEKLWNVLTRQPDKVKSSLIALPHPYIVPGGRFGEIYYWDSYFTMLGLRVSGRTDLIQHMVDNFSYLIDQIGYIPNGNRTYYLGRSQPPFFSLMVKLLSREKGDATLLNYLPQIEKEYSFWMSDSENLSSTQNALSHVVKLPDGEILNRYWDANDTPRPEAYKEDVELAHGSSNPKELYRHIRAAAESGWDFSSRWFREPNQFSTIHTTEIIPVDLNCLLMFQEELLSKIYKIKGESKKQQQYEKLATNRKAAIQKYCWNESEKFYFDYDLIAQQPKSYLTLAGVFPLFFKVAETSQAKVVASVVEKKFLQKGGLTTTLLNTGQQWDAPNGWAPLQWITYMGCHNYGQSELANKVKKAWLNTNDEVFRNTGKMMEKYNVMGSGDAGGGGEYPNQDGFGWTNGVYLAMLASQKGN